MARPGFYIAHHPWLDHVRPGAPPGGLYKVGHTGDLRMRLNDGAYVTCFPPGWRYVLTLETSDKDSAWLLESAVLDCAAAVRLTPRELVQLPLGQLLEIARGAAAALEVVVAAEDTTGDAYERVQRPRTQTIGDSAGTGGLVSDRYDAAARARLVNFVVAPPPAQAQAQAPAPVPVPVPAPAPPTTKRKTKAKPKSKPKAQDTEDNFYDDDRIEAPPAELEDLHVEARAYQRDAVADCRQELATAGRTILQMACRSGKTYVAHRLLTEYLEAVGGRGRVLFLVPSLALLSQTAQKLHAYRRAEGLPPAAVLLVGSDPRKVLLPGGGELAMTTEPAQIARFLGEGDVAEGGGGGGLVVSTYHSSGLLPDVFDLVVFDEAHRTAGPRAPRPANSVLLGHRRPHCLFMTATPVFGKNGDDLTMSDAALYGRVAYHYHLRQGIAAGYITDFRVEFVGGAAAAAADGKLATWLTQEKPAGFGTLDTLARQVAAAMQKVDRLLVFCGKTKEADALAARVAELVAAGEGGAPFHCVAAHSGHAPLENAAALALLRGSGPNPNAKDRGALAAAGPAAPTRVALFNCRYYQEGTEIPPLDGVFFAAPRQSPRDIMQIICRALNRWPGKVCAYVFLPVVLAAGEDLNGPLALGRFAKVTPIIDALIQEDPRLFDHLLDPEGATYPIAWVSDGGPAAAGLTAARRAQLLQQMRRVLRNTRAKVLAGDDSAKRLLRSPLCVPWDVAFAFLRDRVVGACRRYPKLSKDLMPYGDVHYDFGAWMKHVRARWGGSAEPPLTAEQRRQLEGLPGWYPYGLEGPYPVGPCLAFLESWLEAHDGVPPMIEINKGGFVGLEATMMERLSGLLTTVNQADWRSPLRRPLCESFIGPRACIFTELSRISARFGLIWPKPRGADGRAAGLVDGRSDTAGLALSFIQEAYARFLTEYGGVKAGQPSAYIERWFPGYPRKHLRQEALDVQASGAAPRRRAAASIRKRKKKYPTAGARK